MPPPSNARARQRSIGDALSRANLSIWHGLRLRCSQLGEHLHHSGLRLAPTCYCQLADEDAQHFFVRCQNFTSQRRHLLSVLIEQDLPATLEVLLAGDDAGLPTNVADDVHCAVLAFVHNSRRLADRYCRRRLGG